MKWIMKDGNIDNGKLYIVNPLSREQYTTTIKGMNSGWVKSWIAEVGATFAFYGIDRN